MNPQPVGSAAQSAVTLGVLLVIDSESDSLYDRRVVPRLAFLVKEEGGA